MKNNVLKGTAFVALCLSLTVSALGLVPAQGVQTRKPLLHRNPATKLMRPHDFDRAMTRIPMRIGVPAAAAAGRQLELLGSEVYVTSDPGIYSLTWQDSPVFTLVAQGPDATGSGVLVGDTYYCVNNIYGTTICAFSSYNANTWEQNWSYVQYNMDCYAHDMTYDPVDGKIYGCFMKSDEEGKTYDDRYAWGTLDPETQTRQELGEMELSLAAVAANKAGEIYGLDYNGILYSINKADGSLTRLADTGLKSTYATGGIIDEKSGKMVYILQPEDGFPAVYYITLPSGESELATVFDNYQQMRGLFFPVPLAEEGAPAMPTDLKLQFSGDALFGIFNATIPTKTYGGEELTGELTCTVSLDGVDTRTFTTYPGQTLYEFMEIAEPGMHTFAVKVANDAGTSPVAEISQWIGTDELTPVKNVKLALEGDMVSLTWDAPEPVHGGYYDPDLLTYDITRLPDGEMVARGALFNVYMGMLPETESMKMWKFRVDAVYDGQVISTAESNAIKTGNDVMPPFSTSFDSQEEFNLFTVINVNEDEFNWYWSDFYGAENCASIKYNLNEAMDDWLITPGIKLVGGKAYKVSFLAYCAGRNYPERLEVMYGTSPTVEAMTTHLMEPTDIADEAATAAKTTLMLTPEADGTYYIGFHGISDPGMFYLYLDEFSISESTGKAPGLASEVMAEADFTLPGTVNISFVTPAVDENGNDLEAITSAILTRNGAKIAEFTNPAPGTELKYTDTEVPEGTNVYKVTCVNSYGEGATVSTSVFVGEDEPGPVTLLKVSEPEKGRFHISWEAPQRGFNGGYLDPANLTYHVERVNVETGEMTTVSRGFTATEIDDTFEPEQQTAIAYTVRVSNPYGNSRWITSESFIAGPGHPYPFEESVYDGKTAYTHWVSEKIKGQGEWFVAERGVAPLCTPQDVDGGMFEFVGLVDDDEARLASGAIDVSAAGSTQMSFWYYVAGNNTLMLEVSADNRQWETALTIDLAKCEKLGWNKAVVDLAPYGAKRTLRIAFRGVTHDTATSIYVDNIVIKDASDYNLRIASYEKPDNVTVGNELKVSAVIENTGLNKAENAKAELYRREALVATADIPALETGETATVNLKDVIDPGFGDEEAYFIAINYDKDSDENDNREYFRVRLIHNLDFPAPTGLAADVVGNNVSLKWDSPAAYTSTGEGFENYYPFGYSDRIGGWTTLNRTDSDKITPVDGSSAIDYPTAGYALGFQVFNAKEAGVRGHDFDAHGGEQTIATFAAKVGVNDDWLISPELSGQAQTVKFFAKAASPYYTEKFDVLYSTTTDDPLAFTAIGETREVKASWTEYTVELPADARYLAIRYCSFDCYGLLLDDISFSSRASGTLLSGYKVYRDGIFVGDAAKDSRMFSDIPATTEKVTYAVTAVYDLGESPFSDIITVSFSSLDVVGGSAITVTGMENEIRIAGAAGRIARIINAQGMTVASRLCGDYEAIPVVLGVYLVVIDNDVRKIMIK